MTAHQALSDRPDLQGLLGLSALAIVATLASGWPLGTTVVLLQVAFTVFGYATVRAALRDPGTPTPEAGHDTDGDPEPAPSPALTDPPPGLLADLYRRAFPALWLTLTGTVLASALLLSARKAEWTASLAAAGAAFVSNILVAASEPAQTAPLGHLWAVSLAAQWALLAALLGALSRRVGSRTPVWIGLLLLAAGSAVALVVLPPQAATLPTGFAPFALGGLMVILDDIDWQHTLIAHLSRETLLLTGAGAIGAAIMLQGRGDALVPAALAALLPGLGAAAILFARGAPTLGHLLTNLPARTLGAAAYAIFLVHWPIAMMAETEAFYGSVEVVATAYIVIVLVAGLALHGIGRLISHGLDSSASASAATPTPRLWITALIGGLALGCLIAAILHSDGTLLSGRPALR